MFSTTIQSVHVLPISIPDNEDDNTMQTNNNIWSDITRQDNSCKDQSSQLDQSNFNKTNWKHQYLIKINTLLNME